MNVSLRQVIRIVVRSDSDPARQVLFANLMQSRLSVRLAYGLHERLDGTWASALLVSCYGLAPFLGIVPSRDANSLAALGPCRAGRAQAGDAPSARQPVCRGRHASVGFLEPSEHRSPLSQHHSHASLVTNTASFT